MSEKTNYEMVKTIVHNPYIKEDNQAAVAYATLAVADELRQLRRMIGTLLTPTYGEEDGELIKSTLDVYIVEDSDD